MEIINYCTSKNADLDVEFMAKNTHELFGKTNKLKQQIFSVIKEMKKEYKGHIFIPFIVLNKIGLPEHFLEINSGKYIIIKLDALLQTKAFNLSVLFALMEFLLPSRRW